MVYIRGKKGSVNLQRASLVTLQRHLGDAKAHLEWLESSLAECQLKNYLGPSKLDTINHELAAIDVNLTKLYNVRQPKKGLLASVFKLTEQPSHVKSEISSLLAQRSKLQEKQREIQTLEWKINNLKSSIENSQSWISKINEGIERKQRKKETLIELRAAAAANSSETRKAGTSVKRKLARQPWCPYCGNPLGSDPHADHIYPVSKGGRSVPRNMVYVCPDCNARKRDLTLQGFIRKHSLNRETIESRLEELGKDY